MKRLLIGSIVLFSLFSSACASTEESGPAFQLTSPSLATTSTTAPKSLEYLGVPDLSAAENAMCAFVSNVGVEREASDQQSIDASLNAKNRSKDRTLSEPLRARMLRDTEIANARRFANVLSRFDKAIPLIEAIEPSELTDQATLDRDAGDAALLSAIAADLNATIESVRPKNATEKAEHLEATGSEWVDIFTDAEYEAAARIINNSETGMGRETEAREAMERLDDWSWRHCSAGLTR